MCVLEAKFRVGVLCVNKSLVRDILQHEITALDKTRHLVLFVHSVKRDIKSISSSRHTVRQLGMFVLSIPLALEF